jgi:hypothetical protein
MISSQEFQQTLQTGKIHEALALLVRDAVEIDVTTRLTEDSTNSQTQDSGYLRTKINLLTGEIQNEVGKDIVTDRHNYIKLQQLHTDRILDSDRIVQGYLHQLKAVLTDLSTCSFSQPLQAQIEPARLPTTSLAERLAQAALLLKKDPVADTSPPQQSVSTPTTATDQEFTNPVAIDDDLDLSIDLEGEVWEEWVEDEDFGSGSILPQVSSPLPALTIPDYEENLVRRHLNSLAVKPVIPRTTPESVSSSPHWDNFAPDYIDTDYQPRIAKNSDSHDLFPPSK